MTNRFYEIILSELINRRNIAEVALSEIYYKKELSVKERIESSIDLLSEVTDINNNIQTLSSLFTEKDVESSLVDDNNNN
tara:strand:- start:3465 stop:3704 length:240 start_codon:yes stop_codon:yes gene_type:complete